MISENRDILVERLEQKLVAKEREISELNDSLKESIIAELREGMKEDLDFDKRISAIETKVKDIRLSFDGVMKELLDQKTIIQDFKKMYLKNDVENSAKPVGQPDKTNSLSNWYENAQKTKKPAEPDEDVGLKSQYIIAESEDTRVPGKDIVKEKGNEDIIIAENTTSRSSRKNDIIVEAREDEDVVIEYKK
ncbi:MAG: hypothetical protein KAR85_04060 [Methanosarcinales archaeon]|nr:hypothetical protein [Methanosarcinales archaeon]